MYKLENGTELVYQSIIGYKAANGGPSPSIKEVMEDTPYNSTKPIYDRLTALEKAHAIKRKHRTPRSIVVVGGEWVAPPVPKDMSGMRKKVWLAFRDYCKKNDGNPPTLRDICQAVGFKSDSTAKYYISKFVKDGLLIKVGQNHRCLSMAGARWTIEADKYLLDVDGL